MLVLARKVDERIFIGDDITITVVELRDNDVKLGIDAPKDTLILREELADKPDLSEVEALMDYAENNGATVPEILIDMACRAKER